MILAWILAGVNSKAVLGGCAVLIVLCRLLHLSECSLDFFVIAGQKKLHAITVSIEENPIR